VKPKDILTKYFGYTNFRTGQEDIIDSILKKENVLAIMPTGAGKSLCYQIPALLQDRFSLVISPLISLMKDQVDNLNKNEKLASFINSSLDYLQTEKVLNDVAQNKIKLLYISPEKLENREFINRIKNLKPEFLFVDEAHCISEWGHSFRPSYRKINDFREFINVKSISAFTATATPEVREDIINELKMKNPKLFIYGFERDNIQLRVIRTSNKKEKLLELIKDEPGATIVYTSTRRHAEGVAKFLAANKLNVKYYHAGLTTGLRRIIQDDFLNDRTKIIVATSAFGMGIDKENIRMVIHYNIPGSIENLYQEFGRAGRDGNPSKAFLLFKEKDIEIQKYFINNSTPTAGQVRRVYDTICDVANIAVSTRTEKPVLLDKKLKNILKLQNIPAGLLSSSIQILQEAGYLLPVSNFDNSFYLKFIPSKNEILKFIKSVDNNTLRDIIYVLLREYGETVINSLTKINVSKLEKELTLSIKAINENLDLLKNIGIITYEKPSAAASVKLATERIISKNLIIGKQKLEKTKNVQLKKLDKIIEYAQTDECRFKFILNYFGENKKKYRCEKCDICLGITDEFKTLSNYIEEIIIRTLQENRKKIRAKNLYPLLAGKSKTPEARSFTTFGICAHYSKQEIEDALQKLLLEGKLKIIDDYLFLNNMDIDNLLFEIDTEAEKNENFDYEENLILFNKLREQRSLTSKKYNQPPNIICPDNILRNIAKIKPTTPTKLLSVTGFNQRMFNKIGNDFISIIDEHIKTHKQTTGMKKNLPQDLYQTYELIKKGYKLEDIAELMRLPAALISLQVESIIGFEPGLNIDTLLDPEEYNLISEKIENGITDLKELKNLLPNKINYAKIRIVLTKHRLFSSQD